MSYIANTLFTPYKMCFIKYICYKYTIRKVLWLAMSLAAGKAYSNKVYWRAELALSKKYDRDHFNPPKLYLTRWKWLLTLRQYPKRISNPPLARYGTYILGTCVAVFECARESWWRRRGGHWGRARERGQQARKTCVWLILPPWAGPGEVVPLRNDAHDGTLLGGGPLHVHRLCRSLHGQPDESWWQTTRTKRARHALATGHSGFARGRRPPFQRLPIAWQRLWFSRAPGNEQCGQLPSPPPPWSEIPYPVGRWADWARAPMCTGNRCYPHGEARKRWLSRWQASSRYPVGCTQTHTTGHVS